MEDLKMWPFIGLKNPNSMSTSLNLSIEQNLGWNQCFNTIFDNEWKKCISCINIKLQGYLCPTKRHLGGYLKRYDHNLKVMYFYY